MRIAVSQPCKGLLFKPTMIHLWHIMVSTMGREVKDLLTNHGKIERKESQENATV